MRPKSVRDRLTFSVERLETRDLLAAQWAPAARLIAQDVAAANYPNLTGAGETVVIIDSGVDYKHPSLGGGRRSPSSEGETEESGETTQERDAEESDSRRR